MSKKISFYLNFVPADVIGIKDTFKLNGHLGVLDIKPNGISIEYFPATNRNSVLFFSAKHDEYTIERKSVIHKVFPLSFRVNLLIIHSDLFTATIYAYESSYLEKFAASNPDRDYYLNADEINELEMAFYDARKQAENPANNAIAIESDSMKNDSAESKAASLIELTTAVPVYSQPVASPVAPTKAPDPVPSQPAAPAASEADEILKFKNLLDMGIITQEEFDAKKKQILGL